MDIPELGVSVGHLPSIHEGQGLSLAQHKAGMVVVHAIIPTLGRQQRSQKFNILGYMEFEASLGQRSWEKTFLHVIKYYLYSYL